MHQTHFPSLPSPKCAFCSEKLSSLETKFCLSCSESESPGQDPTPTSKKQRAESLSSKDIKGFLAKCSEPETPASPKYLSPRASISTPRIAQQISPSQFKASLLGKVKAEVDNKVNKICSLCDQSCPKQFIYQNPDCEHKFCFSCIEELVISHQDFESCYMKKCSAYMASAGIEDFIAKCLSLKRTNLVGLQDLSMELSLTFPPSIIENFDCYLDGGKLSTDIFFLLGVLLIQDKLDYECIESLIVSQKHCLSSFKSLPTDDHIQKFESNQMQRKLEEFFENVNEFIREKVTPEEAIIKLNLKAIMGDFILNECYKDKELIKAIQHTSRCWLIMALSKQENPKKRVIFKQLIDRSWSLGKINTEELIEAFCESFEYRFTFISVSESEFNLKDFGNNESCLKAAMLRLDQNECFRGILYQTK